MSLIITEIRKNLKKNSNKELAAKGKKFFKEEIKSYGYKISDITKFSKEYYKKKKDKPKEKIFLLCEELWQSGYLEESFIACNWSYYIKEKYMPEDFVIFENWINKYVNNWASCDTLCNHTVGDFIIIYPEYVEKLKEWAKSSNRWARRAAAVSLIIPARKGKFLADIIDIANILLNDNDDLVQKGYGWMLKASSEAYQKEIFNYVMKNKDIMPRTALRYAIEKMPKELKTKAMEKSKANICRFIYRLIF